MQILIRPGQQLVYVETVNFFPSHTYNAYNNQSVKRWRKDGPSLYGPDHDQRREKAMDRRIFNIARRFLYLSKPGEQCWIYNKGLHDQSTDNSIKPSLPPKFLSLVPGMFPHFMAGNLNIVNGKFCYINIVPPISIQGLNKSIQVVKAENLPTTWLVSLPPKKKASWVWSRLILKLSHVIMHPLESNLPTM